MSLAKLWAYFTLGAMGIVWEEASPLLGGLAARARHLHLSLVIAWVAGGTWVAGILLYYLGRWRSTWVRQRWPGARPMVLRAFQLVRRHPWRSSLATRFAFGLRLTIPFACGAARVKMLVFFIGSAISSVAWSAFYTHIGWGFGEASLRLLGHLRRYERTLAIIIVVFVLVMFFVLRKRHVGEEVVEVLGGHE